MYLLEAILRFHIFLMSLVITFHSWHYIFVIMSTFQDTDTTQSNWWRAFIFELNYYLFFWRFERKPNQVETADSSDGTTPVLRHISPWPGYLAGLRQALIAIIPQLTVTIIAYFIYTFGLQFRELMLAANQAYLTVLIWISFAVYVSFVLRAGDVAIKQRNVERSSFGASIGRFVLFAALMFGPTLMLIQCIQDPIKGGHVTRTLAMIVFGDILALIFLAVGRRRREKIREKSKRNARRAQMSMFLVKFGGATVLTVGFVVLMLFFYNIDRFSLVPPSGWSFLYVGLTIIIVNFALCIISGVFFTLMAMNELPWLKSLSKNFRIGSFTLVIASLLIIRFVSGLCCLSAWHPDNRGVADVRIKEKHSSVLTLAKAVDRFDKRYYFPEEISTTSEAERQRRMIFVADGGGIHAAYRAARVLAEMYDDNPESLNQVFATSTVSGGSIGTALVYAIVYAIESQKSEEKIYSVVKEVDAYFDHNLLVPVIGRMFFTEWASMVVPAADRLDRGKALEISVIKGLGRIDKDLREKAEEFLNSGILTGEPIKRINTTLIFNTTMQSTGERFLLTNMLTPTMKSLANLKYPQDVSILSAACASARFPIVTHVARVRTGFINGVPQYVYLSDGGIYENSGLETAIELIRGIRALEATGNQKRPPSGMMVTVVGNSVMGRINTEQKDLSVVGPMMLDQDEYRSDLSSLTSTVLNGIFARNSANALRLRDYSEEYGFHLIYFPWCGNVISSPLGWYLSPARRNLIDGNLGFAYYHESDQRSAFKGGTAPFSPTNPCVECKFTLSQMEMLGPNPTNAPPTSQLAAVRDFNRMSMVKIEDFWWLPESVLESIESKAKSNKSVSEENIPIRKFLLSNGKYVRVNLRPFSEVLGSSQKRGTYYGGN
ncbi:MAG: patatin-like phospholipase family protein [Fimbriimonadaceae bacterium]|nr:MAG: patatin-like phospholipase family protein [Fimbriimonadaceae bacterium]